MHSFMEPTSPFLAGPDAPQVAETAEEAAFVEEVLRDLAQAGWIVTMRWHPYLYICELVRFRTRVVSEACPTKLEAVVQAAARASSARN